MLVSKISLLISSAMLNSIITKVLPLQLAVNSLRMYSTRLIWLMNSVCLSRWLRWLTLMHRLAIITLSILLKSWMLSGLIPTRQRLILRHRQGLSSHSLIPIATAINYNSLVRIMTRFTLVLMILSTLAMVMMLSMSVQVRLLYSIQVQLATILFLVGLMMMLFHWIRFRMVLLLLFLQGISFWIPVVIRWTFSVKQVHSIVPWAFNTILMELKELLALLILLTLWLMIPMLISISVTVQRWMLLDLLMQPSI